MIVDVQIKAEKINREKLRLFWLAQGRTRPNVWEQGTNQSSCTADHVKEKELVFMNNRWRNQR
jgi:hypothetical protein